MLHLMLALALAGDPAPATAPSKTPAPEESAMVAARLAWLAGTWVQQTDDTRTEETWLPPEADALFGISRSTKSGKTVFYEHLRIQEQGGKLVYVAWPRGAKSETAFPATAITDHSAVFENPTHDFPTRLAYTRTGDALHVEVKGPDGDGFELDFTRVK